jgi:hypothetical protein
VNFLRDLRLRLAYGGIDELAERVDDRMARFGLRMGKDAQSSAQDQVREWIELGGERKRITREILLEVIEKRKLRTISPAKPKVSLWIHAWAKKRFDLAPTVELDWTRFFDRGERRIPAKSDWPRLMSDLESARVEFSKNPEGHYIDFRGKIPLTLGLAVGAAFPEVGGYSFRAEQPTETEILLWNSASKPSDATFVVRGECGASGDDLLISLGITGSGWIDSERFFQDSAGRFSKLISYGHHR